jgi:hypothetical protein
MDLGEDIVEGLKATFAVRILPDNLLHCKIANMLSRRTHPTFRFHWMHGHPTTGMHSWPL